MITFTYCGRMENMETTLILQSTVKIAFRAFPIDYCNWLYKEIRKWRNGIITFNQIMLKIVNVNHINQRTCLNVIRRRVRLSSIELYHVLILQNIIMKWSMIMLLIIIKIASIWLEELIYILGFKTHCRVMSIHLK